MNSISLIMLLCSAPLVMTIIVIIITISLVLSVMTIIVIITITINLFLDAKEVDDPLVFGLVGGDQNKHHVALVVGCHLRWDQ